MSIRTFLKPFFTTGSKPTQAQYEEVIDSLAHKTEDFDKLGGGLKDHSATREYAVGEAAIKNGIIYRAIQGGAGVWNLAEWVPVKSDPSSMGFTNYSNTEEYAGNGIFRIYKLQLYRTINLASGSIEGLAPDDPEEGANYWEPIGYLPGANIPVWQTDSFVEYGTVYEFGGTGEFATPGGYRCVNALENADKGFFSSDFQTETEEGYWVKVWKKPVEGGFIRVYKALISQSGTTPPTATVLENTTGGTLTWSYTDAGAYSLDITGTSFTANKTRVLLQMASDESQQIFLASLSTSSIGIFTGEPGNYQDGVLQSGSSILVEIYP